MKILVTGATGFIGRHVVQLLLDNGYNLRLFVRDPDRLESPVVAKTEVAIGSIEDLRAVRTAAAGCTHIIHLAGLAARWQKDPMHFFKVNAEGTSNVLQAAYEHSVIRVVYTSSCSACRISGHLNNNEMTISVSTNVSTPYGRSKAYAMEHVHTMRSVGLDVAAVYPTRVFGADESGDANAAGFVLAEYLRGKFPFSLGDGEQQANWAYVRDVANGIVQCLTEGPRSADYILGGENHSLAGLRRMLDGMTGKQRLKIGIPAGAAQIFASLEELRSNVFGVRPFITPGWLETMLEPSRFDCARAVHLLGYRITPIKDALGEIIEWANSPNHK